MESIRLIPVILAGYLLGSLSLAVFLSQRLGADIRTLGSGNAGATNMARVYGALPGVAVLLFDIGKAAAAMLLGAHLAGESGLAAAGIACVLGHCYPILHGFRGGKAVSVGAAASFAVDGRVGVAALAIFAVTVLLSKKVSLGSVCAALSVAVTALLVRPSAPRLVLALFAALMLLWRHRENIARLRSGTEKDFRFGKRG